MSVNKIIELLSNKILCVFHAHFKDPISNDASVLHFYDPMVNTKGVCRRIYNRVFYHQNWGFNIL